MIIWAGESYKRGLYAHWCNSKPNRCMCKAMCTAARSWSVRSIGAIRYFKLSLCARARALFFYTILVSHVSIQLASKLHNTTSNFLSRQWIKFVPVTCESHTYGSVTSRSDEDAWVESRDRHLMTKKHSSHAHLWKISLCTRSWDTKEGRTHMHAPHATIAI